MSELPESLALWARTLPPEVQRVVREKPPTTCYRSIENDGHYWPQSVSEGDGLGVTYTLLHGSDSFLPGFSVFGVDPDTLPPCACGLWACPSDSQIEAARRVADTMVQFLKRDSAGEALSEEG